MDTHAINGRHCSAWAAVARTCCMPCMQVAKPRAQASAALRLIGRHIVRELFGSKEEANAFLSAQWDKDYAGLPDIEYRQLPSASQSSVPRDVQCRMD